MPPETLGRLPVDPDEGAAHALGIVKTDGASNNLNRFVTILYAGTRFFGTEPLHRSCWRFTRFVCEIAAELSRTEMGDLGQALDG